MTKEQVIAWAREAASGTSRNTLPECYALHTDELERFAALVRDNYRAELLKGVGEPVAEFSAGAEFGEESDWNIDPIGPECDKINDKHATLGREYTTVLYTADQLAAAVLVARNQALEEAADVVDDAYTPDCGGWTASGIADAIRNLKETE